MRRTEVKDKMNKKAVEHIWCLEVLGERNKKMGKRYKDIERRAKKNTSPLNLV